MLDVLQVIAYSQRSGILYVEGPATKGTVLFDNGTFICGYTASTLSLLVKAAKEEDAQGRLALRRIQALVFLTELFDLSNGVFQFVTISEPVPELAGLKMGPFYSAGGLDTGDLLLVLAKVMDEEPEASEAPTVAAATDYSEQRSHTRISPTVLRAELAFAGTTVRGYLTDLSLGGAFFHAEVFPGVGDLCDLYFTLPRETGICRTSARAAWCRTDAGKGRRGVGLSFVQMSEEFKTKLTNYLEWFERFASNIEQMAP